MKTTNPGTLKIAYTLFNCWQWCLIKMPRSPVFVVSFASLSEEVVRTSGAVVQVYSFHQENVPLARMYQDIFCKSGILRALYRAAACYISLTYRHSWRTSASSKRLVVIYGCARYEYHGSGRLSLSTVGQCWPSIVLAHAWMRPAYGILFRFGNGKDPDELSTLFLLSPASAEGKKGFIRRWFPDSKNIYLPLSAPLSPLPLSLFLSQLPFCSVLAPSLHFYDVEVLGRWFYTADQGLI